MSLKKQFDSNIRKEEKMEKTFVTMKRMLVEQEVIITGLLAARGEFRYDVAESENEANLTLNVIQINQDSAALRLQQINYKKNKLKRKN